MPTPLPPAHASASLPIGELSRLPHEVLVHGVLPHLAVNAKYLRQFALVSRGAREASQASAAYIMRSTVSDLLLGTDLHIHCKRQASSVRSPRFNAAQHQGATTYLNGLAGRAQLEAAKRQTARQPLKAIRNFTYVLQRWPKTPGAAEGLLEAHLNQGLRAWKLGDLVAAYAHCSEVLQAAPATPQAYHLMADIRRKQGDNSGAIGFFCQLMGYEPIAFDRICFAELLVEVGNFAAARGQLASIKPRDRTRELANFLLARCQLALGQPEQAEKLFRDNTWLASSNAPLFHFFVGESLLAQGRDDEANAQFLRASAPTGIVGHYYLAGRGSRNSKLFDLTKPLRTATARLRVADALYGAKSFPGAESHYLKAREADPNLPEAHYGLGRCAVDRGAFHVARASFAQAVALRADYPEALAALQRLGGEPSTGQAANMLLAAALGPPGAVADDNSGLTDAEVANWNAFINFPADG